MPKLKTFYVLFFAALLAACNQKIDIQGETSIRQFEGHTLNLRIFDTDSLRIISECKVCHGRFHFEGTIDSTVMAFLFLEEESLLPLVLDGSPLTMVLSDTERSVKGNNLNDSLFSFIARKEAIDSAIINLPRRESQMLLNGMSHEQVIQQLTIEASVLQTQEEEVVFDFIKENMDNVLGPGIFMIATSNFPYPVLNPQIEELITFATPTFLNNSYVKEYLRLARKNMEQIHGE